MAKFRAQVACDLQMIVDDQADARTPGDGQNFFRQPPDFVRGGIFGAQLDQIAAAIAQLLRDEFRRAAMQVGRVHEGVKFAVRERFHRKSLTANHAKYTKEFTGKSARGLAQSKTLRDIERRGVSRQRFGLRQPSAAFSC